MSKSGRGTKWSSPHSRECLGQVAKGRHPADSTRDDFQTILSPRGQPNRKRLNYWDWWPSVVADLAATPQGPVQEDGGEPGR